MASKRSRLRVEIRPLVRADLPEVMNIDRLSNPCPWSHSDFMAYFRQGVALMHVAEAMVFGRPTIAGLLVYYGDISANMVHVTNVAVHPALRRRRVGSQLLMCLVARKTMGDNPRRLEVIVPERSVGAQLWLKKLQFVAESTVPDCFGDGPEAQDGYLFTCSQGEEASQVVCREAGVEVTGDTEAEARGV